MPELVRTGSAHWSGDLKSGRGAASSASGALKETPYTFASRFESAPATNPEELIAAAHAACYAMALSNMLASEGHSPTEVRATVKLRMRLDAGGASIVASHIECEGRVPGITAAEFEAVAVRAKDGCPVSRLLKPGLESVTLDARLV
ncbi:MAG: OsmC family peroxiredoxin [Acidobacteriota bacterium]